MLSNKTDELNHGYLSHNWLMCTFYRVIDFFGYKLFRKRNLAFQGNKLLFINLGLIGDLILFRYVIQGFLQLGYQIDILIREENKFLFANIANIRVITVKNYKYKHIIRGFIKLHRVIKQQPDQYDVSCHFRAYLGTGIFATFLSNRAKNLVGYGTAGFGFLLNRKLTWQAGAHEANHLGDILRVLNPDYQQIDLTVFNPYLDQRVIDQYNLVQGEYIVIHATSQDSAKNIPKNVLSNTIQYLLKMSSLKIVFVGVVAEKAYIEDCLHDIREDARIKVINGRNTFFEVGSLINFAKFFIGIDSSLAHLASSFNLPKIIVWHSQNLISQWRPLGDKFYILEDLSGSTDSKDNVLGLIEQIDTLHLF